MMSKTSKAKRPRARYDFTADMCKTQAAADWVKSLPRDQFVDLARFLRQQHDRDVVYEQRTSSNGLSENTAINDKQSVTMYLDDLCLDDIRKSVASMLIHGYRRVEIADTLGLSLRVVSHYVDDIGKTAVEYANE